MNIVAWVAEVRRLLKALKHEPTDIRLRWVPKSDHPECWEAATGSVRVTGSSPEEATAKVVEELGRRIAVQVATHRAELERLEKAQASGLHVVKTEKPS